MKTDTSKILPHYTDYGFGFPVILRNVSMVKVRGVWSPEVNYRDLAARVLRLIAEAAGRVSGDQIRFIRQEMGMTLAQFAARFGVTHPAVLKWERRGAKPTGMTWSTEKDIRLSALKHLNCSDKELAALYGKLEAAAPNHVEKIEIIGDKIAA